MGSISRPGDSYCFNSFVEDPASPPWSSLPIHSLGHTRCCPARPWVALLAAHHITRPFCFKVRLAEPDRAAPGASTGQKQCGTWLQRLVAQHPRGPGAKRGGWQRASPSNPMAILHAPAVPIRSISIESLPRARCMELTHRKSHLGNDHFQRISRHFNHGQIFNVLATSDMCAEVCPGRVEPLRATPGTPRVSS